jgi:hypothetical protein
MARRPDVSKEVLSREDLKDLRHRLAHLSGSAVRDFYESCYLACRVARDHFPSARQIQELVQAWKQLRKWR